MGSQDSTTCVNALTELNNACITEWGMVHVPCRPTVCLLVVVVYSQGTGGV